MSVIFSIIVSGLTSPQRLYEYCNGKFPSIPSRKGLKKAIDRGEVLIDGEVGKTGDWVMNGCEIQLTESKQKLGKTIELDISIVYEDQFFAVLNKPAGLEVSGNKLRTLQNALPNVITTSTEFDALAIPRPVHRLDYATSGLIIIAKTATTAQKFGNMLEYHRINKKYRAILIGNLSGTGFVNEPLDGKTARSEYSVVSHTHSKKNEILTLVDLYPHTGRTHQLRKHMTAIGFPILGDSKYGKEGFVLKGKGLFLSAVELKFQHPNSGDDVCIAIDQPNKFNLVLQREATMYNKSLGLNS